MVCLPCAVVGAIFVHTLAVSFDTMPGGVFCVDDMCKGHRPDAYQLQLVKSLLTIYLSVLVWFLMGMEFTKRFENSIRKKFLFLLSLAALVPLLLVAITGEWLVIIVVLAGIFTVWIPRFNKQLLCSSKEKK